MISQRVTENNRLPNTTWDSNEHYVTSIVNS